MEWISGEKLLYGENKTDMNKEKNKENIFFGCPFFLSVNRQICVLSARTHT